jgi:hypothetical protein
MLTDYAVPEGSFSAQGEQSIPSQFASQIPSIAFAVPDLDGQARLELKSADTGDNLACITSQVSNGKSVDVPAVSYVAAGIAGAALVVTGISALATGAHPGATHSSPGFMEVVGWFQSMAMNGMMSVEFPAIYRSFAKNFGFSTGLIQWDAMQTSIDNFRKHTGGNLTGDSAAFLKNATLVYDDSTSTNTSTKKLKRGLELFGQTIEIMSRQIQTNVNGTSSGSSSSNSTNSGDAKVNHFVKGIQGYVEALSIPQANTFMTVLLIFAIIVAAIAVGILLLKVILEFWALFASFPKKLTHFRKDYWGILARTIVNLILLLYGIWTLYCVFQFTHGDSWAAKLLAGLTLGGFTAILGFYTFRIWQLAKRYQKAGGDAAELYENKETWKKYSLFYDNYKRGYWWLFVPAIVYMFAKGSVIAAGDGHGLFQTVGQLSIESIMLVLLLWSRPYATKSGNWINIIIQVVRVLSVICILVFVEQLGIAQTTKTITGVVLIAVQSGLTGLLAILIAVNSIIICCRENPHRRRRKEAGKPPCGSLESPRTDPCLEKMNRDLDDLTPLDARNSLLMEPTQYKSASYTEQQSHKSSFSAGSNRFEPYREQLIPSQTHDRFGPRDSTDHLVSGAVGMGHHSRSQSRGGTSVSPPPQGRQPMLPQFDFGSRRM